MAELDDRLLRDLARLRARQSPPPDAKQRVHAALAARLGPDPGGGDGGGADGGGGGGDGGGSMLGDGGLTGGGLGSVGVGGAKAALGAKLLAATAAATSAGALLVGLAVASPQKQTRETASAPIIDVSAPKLSNTDEALSPTPQPEPESEAPILVTPPAAVRVPIQRPSEPEEDLLAAEASLLQQARATEDPQARLELLEQHRGRFETGLLTAERESLRIASLCELGRLDAARTAAEAFLLAHPRSPLRLRMRNACPELDILAE